MRYFGHYSQNTRRAPQCRTAKLSSLVEMLEDRIALAKLSVIGQSGFQSYSQQADGLETYLGTICSRCVMIPIQSKGGKLEPF
jgi:hypothetical protein